MREMKDSGIEWIGKIPSCWSVSRLKPLLIEIKEQNSPLQTDLVLSLTNQAKVFPYEERGNQGNKAKENYEDYKLAYPNTIVLNSMNVLIGSVGLCSYFGCVSPVYYVFRNSNCSDLRYVNYIFQNVGFQKELRKYANGILEIRLRVSAYDILHRMVPYPALSEQQRIADFLDRKCADIDNVLEKTKASIEEYKKLKQSVITEAVTKGIRGERAMKDSGSTWFGQIPNTWDANKLKYTFTIRKRIVGEDGHTVLAITQKGVKPKDMSNGSGQFAESYANYQIVHPGDFAMNHMDLLTGWVDISKYEGVTSPDYRVFTLDDTTRSCPSYYLYMMQMCYSNRIFYSMGQGVSGMGRWRLPADMFSNFIIACPPYEEQQEIAKYLDKKCAEIDSLIASKEKFITELESYKKSLIYEYVTGKKEVPNTK